MKLIGLTGAIASGKSTVAALLQRKGAHVIDADMLAREAVEQGRPAWRRIQEAFGSEVLKPNGELDRAKLGQIVFADPGKLDMLNRIVHPVVMRSVKERLARIEHDFGKEAVVVADIPLLIEVGFHEECDIIVIVEAPPELRLQRLVEKGFSHEEAQKRIDAQQEKDRLASSADVIIKNDSTIEELQKHVDDLWSRITIK